MGSSSAKEGDKPRPTAEGDEGFVAALAATSDPSSDEPEGKAQGNKGSTTLTAGDIIAQDNIDQGQATGFALLPVPKTR